MSSLVATPGTRFMCKLESALLSLKGRFEAERVEQKKDFDDQLSTRVSESRVSFGTTKRAATIKEEPGVAKHDDATEPMMDPEIRSIRRLAMKQRYG